MLSSLSAPPPDPILAVSEAFRADRREAKIDLGVGVYRDEHGRTPVFAAVREAERRLVEEQTSKSYLGTLGRVEFSRLLVRQILGSDGDANRLASLQTIGGTGAVRTLMELTKAANPSATAWLPHPTWPNHHSLAQAVGLERRSFDYAAPLQGVVDIDRVISQLQEARAGDVIVLHGCCHNPTGVDPVAEQWDALFDVCAHRGLVPLLDLAYLGFARTFADDAQVVRRSLDSVETVLMAVSCSKNFGLYRERVGCSLVWSQRPGEAQVASRVMQSLARANYSMPPDHGAAVVAAILLDSHLSRAWASELTAINERIRTMRQELVGALRRLSNAERFDGILKQQGMFSLLGATQAQVDELRQTHAIYVATGGRINIAGLVHERVERVARAVIDAGL